MTLFVSILAWVRVRSSRGEVRGSGLAVAGAAVGAGVLGGLYLMFVIAVAVLFLIIYGVWWFLQWAPSHP